MADCTPCADEKPGINVRSDSQAYRVRQRPILDPASIVWPVHIIGLGAVGSYLAIALAKLGVDPLHLYDPETVGPENVGPQLYGPIDVGRPKAAALAAHIEALTAVTAVAHVERVVTRHDLKGVVVLAVDTMQDRRRIFETSLHERPAVRWLVDVRVGFTTDGPRGAVGLLFTVQPGEPQDVQVYRRSLHNDSTALPAGCEDARSVVYVSMMAAAATARHVAELMAGAPVPYMERILP